MAALLASIPSPSVTGLEIGPLDIRFYGIAIAVGAAIAIVLTRNRYTALGGDDELADKISVRALVWGFAGARAAYVSTHLDRFAGDDWWRVFAIWEGGLALFGGLTVGTIVAIWSLRREGADVPGFADACAVAVPIAQAFGRLGNYANQELFGTPTTLPWALEISPANRPSQYAQFATFHPAFLYELLWNVGLAFVLWRIDQTGRLRRGSLFGLYLAGYATVRFLLELIRTDTTFRLAGLSRNGIVSLIVVVGATAWVVRRERAGESAPAADLAQSADSSEG